MSSNQDIMEKRHVFTDCEEKYVCKVRRNDHNYRQVYEYDKKMKREIANSNERRRMQSINMGFETLKQLLPMTIEGEKLSKASILQFTAKYIQSLIVRLTSLEKEVACYKKNMLNSKEKFPLSKSPSLMQEQNRKRRLNSCSVDLEIAQIDNPDSTLDFSNSKNSNFSSLSQENSTSITCKASEKTPGSLEHLVAAIEQVEGEKFYVGSINTGTSSQVKKEEIKSDASSIIEVKIDSFENVDKPHQAHPHNNPHLQQQQQQVPIQPLQPISDINALMLNSNADIKKQSNSSNNNNNNNNNNNSVMKPTISPYTEKIILAVSQHPHMFENRPSNYSLNISSQPTYQIISSDNLIDSTGLNRHFSGSQRMSIPHKYLHKPDVPLSKNHTL